MAEISVKRFTLGNLATNCYVLFNQESNLSIIIDPGANSKELFEFVKGKDISHILITHGHYDHTDGLENVKALTKGLITAHHSELVWLPSWPDLIIKEDCRISWGNTYIQVMHTPGHSPGGLCFLIGDLIFTGDTLFNGLIGHTGSPGSNREQLIISIKEKLFTLAEKTVVYPGHGSATTIGYEKAYNLFPKIKSYHPKN